MIARQTQSRDKTQLAGMRMAWSSGYSFSIYTEIDGYPFRWYTTPLSVYHWEGSFEDDAEQPAHVGCRRTLDE